MPDYTSLESFSITLSRLDAKILVNPWKFFLAAIEDYKIMQQFKKAGFFTDLEQIFVELETGVILFILLPLQKIFLLSADRAILQPFRIVSGKNELHG